MSVPEEHTKPAHRSEKEHARPPAGLSDPSHARLIADELRPGLSSALGRALEVAATHEQPWEDIRALTGHLRAWLEHVRIVSA